MKKFLAILLCAIMLLPTVPVTVGAETYGDLTYEKYDDHIEITDCDYDAVSIDIPAEIDGLPVTSIGEGAFAHCENLTSVTIPNSVTYIGDSAFEYCHGLISATISGSVTSIGSWMFCDCYSLTSITIPDGVTSIGSWAFFNCNSLTSITIPSSVTIIGGWTFWGCKSITDIYYGGSEEDWQNIYNEDLTGATIHYNSSGGGSTEPTPDSGASTMPADINNVTINYKGTAYGYFEVTDEGGNALKNKSVSYSIDGGAAKTGVTDGYGYLCVQISGITKSRDYSIKISGSGVRPASGVLSVTVKPLEFKSAYEAIMTKGASAGLGIGVGGSIGNLGAEAKAAEIGVSGSNKKGFSYSQERKNGKTHLEVTAKESNEAALKAKVGLWAGASAAVAGAEISAGDIHGSAKYGNELSVGFEDDDFNFKDSGDLTRLAKFMVSALLENMDSNVAARWLLEKFVFKPDTYEKGSTAAVSAGASIGSVKLKSGDQELASVTLGGIDGDAVWSHSTKTSKDNAISRKSSVAADAGVKLGDVNLFKKDGDKFGSGTSAWKKTFTDNKVQFSAENNKNGDLTSLGVTWTDDESNSIFWNKKSVSNTRSITYSGDAADKVASSYSELRDFADGRKGFFSVAQMVKANAAMINSDQKGIFSASVKKTKGVDLKASASGKLFLEIGGELGISGTESYSYETENGIYENNTVYTQAKNDIDSAVEREFFGVEDAFSAAANYMNDLIADCWETVSGFIDNAVNSAVEAGKAAVKKVGDAVTGWKVSITKAVEDISPFSIMAVDSEVSLFSTSSVATTVGSPYIVSVEDEAGNEITDLSSNPLLLVLEYTDEELAAAGVTDIGDVAVYRWDEDKCVYVCLGGTLDEADKSLSLEITKTGQYILAADNCPPAVTEFKASGDGISPEITAIVSDMSGIANFEMTIDGTTVVDNANLGDYYDYTTAEFVYPTSGLSSGSHTAVIYASDTSGNELAGGMSLAFTVDTDVPTINSVTKISEQVTNETEVSADVTGENISAVYLNVEETDALGRSVRSSYEMTAQNETYSAQIQNITQGSQVKIWVTAYNTNGNKSETEKQTALSVPVGNETAVMITSVKDNTVTVTTVNGENVANAHILLAIYDENGILKQAEVKDYSPNLVFNNKDLSEGSIKAYLWNENLQPLSAVAEFDI